MTPERWRQIEELYRAAGAQPPELRRPFLEQSCGEDADLRREVQAFLDLDTRAENFLETPAVEYMAASLACAPELAAGMRIGPYELAAPLGAGGMGRVYRATDTRLGRSVAMKFLSADSAAGEQALRLLEREARAASALNHPNICTLYDIGEHEGSPYLVLELLEGESLKERLGSGPMREAEVLELAIQIAGALEAAHAKGIIHRDIKPANILLTPRGQAKILDFGLAKLPGERSGPQGSSTPGPAACPAADTITGSGIGWGTLAYMSPEQIRGQTVDARTDLYSLGGTLYHLLTGCVPFEESTPELTLGSILNRKPAAPSKLNPRLSPHWNRIVLKTLEKDPDLRYRQAAELRADLERLKRKRGRNAALVRRAFALGATAVLAAFAVWYLLPRGVEAPISHLTFTPLTDHPGQDLYPSFSPDASAVVYAAKTGNNWDIFLQRAGEKDRVNLTPDSPADDTQPAFSADGRIAFRSDRAGGGVFVMGPGGESPRRVCGFGYRPSWSPDGGRMAIGTENYERPDSRFVLRSQVHIVDLRTGQTRLLTPAGQDATEPQWSPRGHRIAYWSVEGGRRDIWTIQADGGEPAPVTNDAYLDCNPVWSPDGNHLYFSSDRGGSTNLWRVRIDERSGKVLGAPEPVLTPSPHSTQVALSADGRRLAYVQTVRTSNLFEVAFDPRKDRVLRAPSPFTRGLREAVRPSPSRDGRWLAFNTFGKEDIFVARADGTGTRQLTDDPHKDREPRWSPDGRRLAFLSNRSGHYEMWMVNPDGSGLRQLTRLFGRNVYGAAWSPDGARLACSFNGGAATYVVEADSSQSPRPVRALHDGGELFVVNDWSRDGSGLAGFHMNRADPLRQSVAVYRFALGRLEGVTEFGAYPRWLNDSRRLIFTNRDRLCLVDVRSRKVRELVSVAPDEIELGVAVSGDNRTIYFARVATEADIWLADFHPPGGDRPSR